MKQKMGVAGALFSSKISLEARYGDILKRLVSIVTAVRKLILAA